MLIAEQVIDVIAGLKDFPKEKFKGEHMIFKDIGFDSLSFLELIVNLEDEFDVELDFLAHETEDISILTLTKEISKALGNDEEVC
jgi:acyl carrier protein